MLSLTTLFLLIHQNAATESGKATMYGGNLDGNACGMDGTADAFSDWKYAAIGSTNFDDGYGCGKCYTITCIGPYGDNPSCSCGDTPTITVQAIDQCPECDDDHFDLNSDALAYITGSSSMAGTCGVIEIEYERVDCDEIDTNFKIINKGGTSQFWYGFHLNDVDDDGGIKSVSLLKDGTQIATCDKSGGPSFWLCNGGAALSESTPLDIKITSDLGKSVTASDCITSFSGGEEMRCNTNLGGGSTDTDDDSDDDEDEDTDEDEDDDSDDDGTINIKVNSNSNVWWMAIEFPNNDNGDITKLEMRDSNHGSWITGSYETWGSGAYSFTDGTQFSGSEHFRITTEDGTASTWNAFSDLSAGSTAYLNMPGGSSYTEEEESVSTSTSAVAGIIAAVLLACLVLGVIGYCIIMNRRKQKAEIKLENKAEDSGVVMSDGDSVGSAASTGYDMSPIDTTAV